jgi:hypothetical protein
LIIARIESKTDAPPSFYWTGFSVTKGGTRLLSFKAPLTCSH